jgi:hypothetical protein
MDKEKSKLRLRKPVIISIPIILIILVLSTILLVNKDKIFAKTIESEKQEQSGFNEAYTSYRLSDSEYFKAFGKLIEDRKKDNTIIAYAEKFNLNISKTLEIAHTITNDYTDEYFLENNVIVPEKYHGKAESYNSFEAGVVYFVRDLYRNPAKYGTTANEIIISNKVETVNFVYGKPLYMSNGLTFEQYYGHIADLYGIDKSTALAMAYHESGYPTRGTSGLFTRQNNIGGMKCGPGCWATYPTMEAGIIAHIFTIKSISEKNGFDISTMDGLYKFSGIYVTGNINKPSELWTSRVLYFKNQIDSKDLFTIK